MKNLSLKQFISELAARLERFSHDELKTILLEHGKDLPPQRRRSFLAVFLSPGRPESRRSTRPSEPERDHLLKEIAFWEERVSQYEYTDGWGWDDDLGEERAWGDDLWVTEADDLFGQIEGFYEEGDYSLARKAYEKMLGIYFGALEDGQLSGYDHDEMMQTDIHESILKYLRCVYLTEKPSSRPQALFDVICRFEYSSADKIDIEAMKNVSLDELPDLDRFGTEWVAFLKKQRGTRVASSLLKEGVRLFEGAKGLETLARENGQKFPGAYLEWLETLKREKAYEEMAQAANLGLEALPEHLEIRARIADCLREAAMELKRKGLEKESLKQAVYASPSLERLLNLLDVAKGQAERRELIAGALSRFQAIERRGRADDGTHDFTRSPDLAENHVPENLEIYCRLLIGEYGKVASLMSGAKPLGWTFGQTINAFAVPFFLYARWNRKRPLAENMDGLWKEATASPFSRFAFSSALDSPGPDELAAHFRDYLDKALRERHMGEKDLQSHFLHAEEAAKKRVEAIVGNKHRKSYWKAAQLLLAVAETWWSNDLQDKGQALILHFRQKYNRHSAFQRELRAMTNKSGLFRVG